MFALLVAPPSPGTSPIRFDTRMKKNMVPTIGKYLRQSGPHALAREVREPLDQHLEQIAERDALVGNHAAARHRELAPHQHAGEEQQRSRPPGRPG